MIKQRGEVPQEPRQSGIYASLVTPSAGRGEFTVERIVRALEDPKTAFKISGFISRNPLRVHEMRVDTSTFQQAAKEVFDRLGVSNLDCVDIGSHIPANLRAFMGISHDYLTPIMQVLRESLEPRVALSGSDTPKIIGNEGWASLVSTMSNSLASAVYTRRGSGSAPSDNRTYYTEYLPATPASTMEYLAKGKATLNLLSKGVDLSNIKGEANSVLIGTVRLISEFEDQVYQRPKRTK